MGERRAKRQKRRRNGRYTETHYAETVLALAGSISTEGDFSISSGMDPRWHETGSEANGPSIVAHLGALWVAAFPTWQHPAILPIFFHQNQDKGRLRMELLFVTEKESCVHPLPLFFQKTYFLHLSLEKNRCHTDVRQ